MIREKVYGKNHPAFSNFLLRLAEYYFIKNQYTEAREPLESSLNICIDKFKPDHPEILKRLVMFAHLERITSDNIVCEKKVA